MPFQVSIDVWIQLNILTHYSVSHHTHATFLSKLLFKALIKRCIGCAQKKETGEPDNSFLINDKLTN